jgi:DNA-binding winged helix-turn-helix (wHTH) protein/Tol biopolymer transport system component
MAETLQRQEVVRFGPFRLDLMNRLLYRGGVEVALPPRAVGILWLLVSRAGQVVSRQELLERVWKDSFVSDTSLAEAISLVRQVLGDDAQQHVFIQTLPRRGYRFVAPVEPEHPDLAEAKTEPRAAGPASATDVALWTPWLPYLLLFSTGLATGLFFVSRVQPSPQTSGGLVRLGIVLPDATLDTHGRPVAVTPRGDTFALVLRSADGTTRLGLRSLSADAVSLVPDSEGAASPFFSPDGRAVAFFGRGHLFRAPVTGGAPSAVAEAPMPLGGAWLEDDTIVFASKWTGGLGVVRASGGEVRSLTVPDASLGELRHAWPVAIPDSRQVLFSVAHTLAAADGGAPAVLEMTTGRVRRVDARSSDAWPLREGHVLLYAPDTTAVAPVDSRWQLVTGTVLALPDHPYVDPASGAAAAAIATSGVRVALDVRTVSQPRWMDVETGRVSPAAPGLEALADLAVAPSGRSVAGVERYRAKADLWVVNLARGVRTRVASAVRLAAPVWSPDGRQLAVAVSDGGAFRVVTVTADASRGPEAVFSGSSSAFASSWMPDGSAIVVTRVDARHGLDLMLVQAATGGGAGSREQATRAPEPAPRGGRPTAGRELVVTAADEANGAISPDGRWVAYETDDTGRWGIALRPVAPGGPTVTIAASGRAPAWRDDRTIIFVDGDRILRVRSRSIAAFDPEPTEIVGSGISRTWRGTTADGRMLVNTGSLAAAPNVTIGWLDDVRARIAASQPLPAPLR